MRSFWSACFGLFCVLGVFTGVGLVFNELPQTDTYVSSGFERMTIAPVANAYEIARHMDAEDETQNYTVIPFGFRGCTLNEERLIRPPYYGENLAVCEWPVYEEPKFPEPKLHAPTLINLTPKFEHITDCVSAPCDDHVRRFPPRMPSTATRSGHCTVRFDVDTDGVPQNIVTPYCSEALFSAPTIASIRKWKYTPRQVDGESVSFEVETIVKYKLTDESGNVIPEAQ